MAVKYTPGERTSCDTTTRSAPLITKVPLSVIHGKSPRKTSCSETSPVSLFTSSTRAQSGLLNVRSLVRHSSSEYFGSRNSLEMKRRSRFFPVKSWIGEISVNSSPRPSSQNHLKLSSWVWIRFGSGRTSGSEAKLRRSRAGDKTRSRVMDIDGPSSGTREEGGPHASNGPRRGGGGRRGRRGSPPGRAGERAHLRPRPDHRHAGQQHRSRLARAARQRSRTRLAPAAPHHVRRDRRGARSGADRRVREDRQSPHRHDDRRTAGARGRRRCEPGKPAQCGSAPAVVDRLDAR